MERWQKLFLKKLIKKALDYSWFNWERADYRIKWKNRCRVAVVPTDQRQTILRRCHKTFLAEKMTSVIIRRLQVSPWIKYAPFDARQPHWYELVVRDENGLSGGRIISDLLIKNGEDGAELLAQLFQKIEQNGSRPATEHVFPRQRRIALTKLTKTL